MRLCCRLLTLAICLSGASAFAYAPDGHQALTFISAKAANRCLEGAGLPRMTALQVRYVARANVALSDRNVFSRMVRWNYYNRNGGSERTLFGMIDTRLHEHYNELVLNLETAEGEVERYQELGRIVSYLQDVTTPSRAVPVFTNRFWRFSFADRFDSYPVDGEAVEAAVAGACSYVLGAVRDLDLILKATAVETLTAVQAPIFGLPVTWEAFWRFAEEAEDFGEFGVAGNSFGRETEFPCGQDDRCVLLRDDPLYQDFARERHISAVLATMRAMVIMQMASAAR